MTAFVEQRKNEQKFFQEIVVPQAAATELQQQ